MNDLDTLTSSEAIKHVSEFYAVKSYYAMAKALSDDKIKVQAIQIANYLKGKNRMSQKVANRFFDVYGVIISDAYNGGALVNNK